MLTQMVSLTCIALKNMHIAAGVLLGTALNTEYCHACHACILMMMMFGACFSHCDMHTVARYNLSCP